MKEETTFGPGINRLISSHLFWWIGVVSVAVFIGTLFAVPVIIVHMPADHFTCDRNSAAKIPIPLRGVLLVVKNVLGIIFLLAGLAMLILPGQGIITIFIGLTLLDFPGKRQLERRLVRIPEVFRSMNWIRARANRPPLEYPDEE